MSEPLRIGILAGEMSGDILGAGLMMEMRQRHPDAVFEGIGGERMQAQGMDSLFPMERLSVMGLIEPLKRLPELLSIRSQLYQHFSHNPPDIFIGIDSPDFCLSLEEKLRRQGIVTAHYVSPSVWAWRRSRIRKIARAVELMLVLFPFEAAFYEERGIPVCCVGHPLADEFPMRADTLTARLELDIPDDTRVLAVLPGSRHSEVSRLARPFLDAARLLRQGQEPVFILLSAANSSRREELEALIAKDYAELDIRLVTGNSRTVMSAADVLLVASGTVTLEALLLKKPMIVCYRMAAFSYAIISRMLKVSFFSLPNLLASEALVPELVQDQVQPDTLASQVTEYLQQPEKLLAVTGRFTEIHRDLQRGANKRAVDSVLELLCKKH